MDFELKVLPIRIGKCFVSENDALFVIGALERYY